MALQHELDAMREQFERDIGDHTARILTDFTRSLRDSGILGRALDKGRRMPDFQLPSASGGTIRLSEVLGTGPAVVFFFRGKW
jgi:hypothetical protein